MKITFIEPNGTRHERTATDGDIAMQVAVGTGVPGILGDCGGSCACATCHVYVPQEWQPRLPEIEGFESDMLEAVGERRPSSRLSCQIRITANLDGLELCLTQEFL